MFDIHTIIEFICILGACAVAWWAISQFTLPPPLRVVVIVLIAIVVIGFLLSVGTGTPLIRG